MTEHEPRLQSGHINIPEHVRILRDTRRQFKISQMEIAGEIKIPRFRRELISAYETGTIASPIGVTETEVTIEYLSAMERVLDKRKVPYQKRIILYKKKEKIKCCD